MCSCDGDNERLEYYDDGISKTRKEHRCDECRTLIPKGTNIHWYTGKVNGEWVRYRDCHACMERRYELHEYGDGCVCFGTLLEDVSEMRQALQERAA